MKASPRTYTMGVIAAAGVALAPALAVAAGGSCPSSPCISPAVRVAAEALGMDTQGAKPLTTVRFKTTGRIAGADGSLYEVDGMDVSMSYVLPAARYIVEKGSVRTVRVFARGLGWAETTPGAGQTPDPFQVGHLAPTLKLTPFGAMWSLIQAEGGATVSSVSGRRVISGVSPLDRYPVEVTLGPDNRPLAVKVEAEGHIFTAKFEDYSDRWGAPGLAFPRHMLWMVDGVPFSDLNVAAVQGDPELIFTPPSDGPQPADSTGR